MPEKTLLTTLTLYAVIRGGLHTSDGVEMPRWTVGTGGSMVVGSPARRWRALVGLLLLGVALIGLGTWSSSARADGGPGSLLAWGHERVPESSAMARSPTRMCRTRCRLARCRRARRSPRSPPDGTTAWRSARPVNSTLGATTKTGSSAMAPKPPRARRWRCRLAQSPGAQRSPRSPPRKMGAWRSARPGTSTPGAMTARESWATARPRTRTRRWRCRLARSPGARRSPRSPAAATTAWHSARPDSSTPGA